MISIHASAREATHPVSSKLLFHLISIHASAREATRYGIIKWMEFYISIHASAREATDDWKILLPYSSISIHASAREATIRSIYDLCCFVHFNPRLREGGDLSPRKIWIAFSLFQSTPPRGRRPLSNQSKSTVIVFQSTPPRGRRLSRFHMETLGLQFQSTPPRGRRQFVVCLEINFLKISIHASAREATSRF